MGIRIQPREIEIPLAEPFKHDLLERKESVEVLTRLVNSFEGPCALAVDAAWGNGKTTFLNLWECHLRSQGFPVIKFNAWETDFSDEPFVALSSELTKGLKAYTSSGDPLEKKINDTKEKAKEVIRRSVPGVIRAVTAGILDLSPLLGQEVGQILASYAKDRLAGYEEAQESIKTFRSVLQDTAESLSERTNHPTIVMIDELDRCRPSYAVELLEVAKHLFSVDHVVFVLAINRAQLAHSIKALYGNEFDAEDYLHRFFDLDFRLPEPSRGRFVVAMLGATNICEYFDRTKDEAARGDYEIVREWLEAFFVTSDLSLRKIAQSIHRLGLVLNSLRIDQRAFTLTAVIALILRTINPTLYHRFALGEASDLDVIDAVFSRPEAKSLQTEDLGCLFEALIIMSAQEVKGARGRKFEDIDSPLLRRYRKLTLEKNYDEREQTEHAERVIDLAQQHWRTPMRGHWFGFLYSVERIELLSKGFLEDQ